MSDPRMNLNRRAAIIIEDDDCRRVYVLREPINFEIRKDEPTYYPFEPMSSVRAVPTVVSIEGELVEGRIWTGDMPMPQQQEIEPERPELETGPDGQSP